MKYLLIIMILSFNVNAEFVAKFGGWSKHSQSEYAEGKKFTEDHKGYGLDYVRGTGDFKFITGAWYMKDSYNKESYQFGIGASYDVNKYITINLALTYFDRSYIEVNEDYENKYSYTYDEGGFITGRKKIKVDSSEVYEIKRGYFVLPLPYVTINLTDRINADVMFLANPFGEKEHVTFVRLGYKF